MSRRLSRKDIKRDDFAASVGSAVDYLQLHSRRLLLAAGALVAVVLVAVGMYTYAQSRERKASDLLAEAIRIMSAPLASEVAAGSPPPDLVFPDAATRQQRAQGLLSQLTADYGSSQAGRVASLYVARQAVLEDRADEARRLWQGFVDHEGETALAAEVHLNLLELERTQGKAEQVEVEIRGMLADPKRPLPEDLLLNELAVTLESLGRVGEAVEIYQRIVDEFPRSPFAAVAKSKTTELGGQDLPTGGLS